jgi:predicted RNA-binding protein (virulence factor B family)
MPIIGQRNKFRVLRASVHGLHLDGGSLGDILLPARYITKAMLDDAELDAFLYRDSEDRLVATTETPLATVGEFAFLRVVSADARIGAFLDWGLSKDLLLPMGEQERSVKAGEWMIVYIYLDPDSDRIVCSARWSRHLGMTAPFYEEGQRVQLLIARETPLGYLAIAENAHQGLLYHSGLSSPLAIGQKVAGYVRTVRPDGRLDLSLDPAGYQRVGPLAQQILDLLSANGGRLALDDKSSPETIRRQVGTSKKAFKQALGALYQQRRIRFMEPGIQLVDEVRRPDEVRGTG